MKRSERQYFTHLQAYQMGKITADGLKRKGLPPLHELLVHYFGKQLEMALSTQVLLQSIEFVDQGSHAFSPNRGEWKDQWLETTLVMACGLLIRKTVAERQRAFTWLIQQYQGRLRQFIQQKVTEAWVEDLTNQTFVIYMERLLDQKVAFPHSIAGYLVGIAQNLIRRHYRQEAIQIRHQANVEAEAPTSLTLEEQVYSQEMNRAVQTLLSQLGENCQQILRLWMMRFNMREIASQLGFSGEAVARTSKRRCMKQLLHILDNQPALHQTLQELR